MTFFLRLIFQGKLIGFYDPCPEDTEKSLRVRCVTVDLHRWLPTPQARTRQLHHRVYATRGCVHCIARTGVAQRYLSLCAFLTAPPDRCAAGMCDSSCNMPNDRFCLQVQFPREDARNYGWRKRRAQVPVKESHIVQ